MLVNEIEDCGFPLGAIMAGIKYLANEDLKTIKFITIRDAIRKFISQVDNYKCQHCGSDGYILMKCQEKGQDIAVACTCTRGGIVAEANEIVRWAGKSEQISNGRMIKRLRTEAR
jgi:hypothetical protein